MRLRPWAIAWPLAVVVWEAQAHAQSQPPEPASDAPSPSFRYDLKTDLSVTLAGGATWIALEALRPTLGSFTCQWCDRSPDGTDTLNGLDRSFRSALRWSDTGTADILSTVFSFGLAPAVGTGLAAMIAAHDHRIDEIPGDALVTLEAAVVAINLNEVAKYAFARERPDVHVLPADVRAARRDRDDNMSFFSGHTTLAFALATSASTIASMQHYRWAPIMWVSGMVLATGSGYLRIAADRHYFTDVLTGALVGGATGFAVPYFFHSTPGADATGPKPQLGVLPAARGAVVTYSSTW